MIRSSVFQSRLESRTPGPTVIDQHAYDAIMSSPPDSRASSPAREYFAGNGVCMHCNKQGHWVKDCPAVSCYHCNRVGPGHAWSRGLSTNQSAHCFMYINGHLSPTQDNTTHIILSYLLPTTYNISSKIVPKKPPSNAMAAEISVTLRKNARKACGLGSTLRHTSKCERHGRQHRACVKRAKRYDEQTGSRQVTVFKISGCSTRPLTQFRRVSRAINLATLIRSAVCDVDFVRGGDDDGKENCCIKSGMALITHTSRRIRHESDQRRSVYLGNQEVSFALKIADEKLANLMLSINWDDYELGLIRPDFHDLYDRIVRHAWKVQVQGTMEGFYKRTIEALEIMLGAELSE
ncbi:hypothetical protein EK21DRAFT_91372 [Setomelanomma holmii]|uniref:CCHC-type domain-containing protein n=1 Tax=Setomelanomma holmii TaxID=210430 RepID=A0A9P4H5H6_9PLEO|nr:hypothetical protein EK21DRAFT_91372 [Setomelanomma holmii]